MSFVSSRFGWIFFTHKFKESFYLVVGGSLFVCAPLVKAAPLMEEGFDYPAGTALSANPPSSGSTGTSVVVTNGNLDQLDLAGISPEGNMLQIGGGTSRTVYRNFSDVPITPDPAGAVYFSALIDCTLLPTNRQFVASLMEAGNTSPNQPDDPLDLYFTTGSGGCRLSVSHTDDDPATAGTILTTNTTHFIVMKYTFGSGGMASIYIDPVPGDPEPPFPDAQTGEGDDDGGGGGSDAANLQIVLFHSPSSAAQGGFLFDTLRIGTNWEDVTPLTHPVSVTDPLDQAVCLGSPASFGVTATGTPPLSYQWETNGIAIADATNDTYTLSIPGYEDAANTYDVVVSDIFGSVTSQPASLFISQIPPGISVSPADQIVLPGATDATFSVEASGDFPLSHQWRTNGIPITDGTNDSYTLVNPGSSDALTVFDVVVSNPCGSVTSSPAVLVFPTAFLPSSALPGFFSGMNLITTNSAGLNLFVWSSPDPSQPITTWALDGQLQEQPLNDGTGDSRYSINVIPQGPLDYYLIGPTTSGPYLEPVPIQWIVTDDFGDYFFYTDPSLSRLKAQ